MESLRGISAVNEQVVWASGTKGTYLRTQDGGSTWQLAQVPGAGELDFRDIHAVDARTAYILSSGEGDKSHIYKTVDGGGHWILQLANPDPKGFFDALAFWDSGHGIALGDPVDGHFVIFTTDDGGARWVRQQTPLAMPNEGAFAASGTCLIVRGKRDAFFATGGPGGARVFHSRNRGESWTIVQAPIRNDAAGAGIFSLAFSDAKNGIAVGGDYKNANDDQRNVAVTADGGKIWTPPLNEHPKGYRSAVAFVRPRKLWITVGTTGSDYSADGGRTWKRFDTVGYNAIAVSSGAAWTVGPQGRVARLSLR